MAGLARAPLAGAEVHWVTRGTTSVYSGMVSGWVAGEYSREACTVELAPLARSAGVELHPEGAVALDAERGAVTLEGGRTLAGDVLSLGLGSAARGKELPGVSQHTLDPKALPPGLEAIATPKAPAVVVGAGLSAIELALCLRTVSAGVTLVVDTEEIPPGSPPALVRAVGRALSGRGVSVVVGSATAVLADAVLLADGTRLEAGRVVWATGPAPHPLLAGSGLALGPTGSVRVDPTLRSTSHPLVFAAGDCADLPRPAPKSGVYSVREGPVLLHNLTAALRGDSLRAYRPQRRALALLNCGDGTALLSWGPLAVRGTCLRRWKHRLDVGFLNRLRVSAQRTVP